MLVCHCASELCAVQGCQRVQRGHEPFRQQKPLVGWVCRRCLRSISPYVLMCPQCQTPKGSSFTVDV